MTGEEEKVDLGAHSNSYIPFVWIRIIRNSPKEHVSYEAL